MFKISLMYLKGFSFFKTVNELFNNPSYFQFICYSNWKMTSSIDSSRLTESNTQYTLLIITQKTIGLYVENTEETLT